MGRRAHLASACILPDPDNDFDLDPPIFGFP